MNRSSVPVVLVIAGLTLSAAPAVAQSTSAGEEDNVVTLSPFEVASDTERGYATTASSSATSIQHQPTNDNISVRIHSPGDDGSVTQTNAAAALAGALNTNATTQSADQRQAGGGGGIQAAGQHADNDQDAEAAPKPAGAMRRIV